MTEKNLSSKQRQIVSLMREGRATPDYILHSTDLPSKHSVQHHLRELQIAGKVEKIHEGLYELTQDSISVNASLPDSQPPQNWTDYSDEIEDPAMEIKELLERVSETDE